MKASAVNNEVVRGGVQAETTFTIKATARSFEILSSGLYSDKIRAIVRELSCNAHDSHVAAGKADTPIEVKLPSTLDQTFYVKDFGTGLSHDDLIQIYTTYFESTKTESDDFIGQLGLGSKSPFSYAPTFTVEARFNGTKRVYTCFKNEQGMPAISLMGEADTDEENGLTVALAVKRDDIEKFVDAARKVFMYFDPKPTIKGSAYFEPYALHHTIAGSNWKIRNAGHGARMEGPYVVQGFVAYPVDGSIFLDRGLSEAAIKLLRTNIDLYVDIGQVEVAASREALSYDLRTVNNLTKVIEQVASEMRTTFQSEFDKCATMWEAAQTFGKFSNTGDYEFRRIFDSMHSNDPFKWNGQEVDTKVELDLSTVQTTTIRRMSQHSRKQAVIDGTWTPDSMTKKTTVDIGRPGLVIIVDTEAKGHRDLIGQYLSDNDHATSVLLLAPTTKKLYNQAEINLIVAQLGGAPVLKSSDLNVVRAKAVRTTTKRTAEQKLVWKGFPMRTNRWGTKEKHTRFSRLCWGTETVTLEDGGLYIDVQRFEARYNGVAMAHIDDIISKAATAGLIDSDVKVYGMTETDKKHIADIPEWVNLIDHLKERFDEVNENGALYNRVIFDHVTQQMSNGAANFFVRSNAYAAQLVDGPFKQFVTKINGLGVSATEDVTSDVIAYLIRRGINTPAKSLDTISESLVREWVNVLHKYGMLSMINWSSVDQDSIGLIVEYINAVDRV